MLGLVNLKLAFVHKRLAGPAQQQGNAGAARRDGQAAIAVVKGDGQLIALVPPALAQLQADESLFDRGRDVGAVHVDHVVGRTGAGVGGHVRATSPTDRSRRRGQHRRRR